MEKVEKGENGEIELAELGWTWQMLSGLLLDTNNISRNGKVEIALHTVCLAFLS